jgi:hypothetical protein
MVPSSLLVLSVVFTSAEVLADTDGSASVTAFISSNLPIVMIETGGAQIPDSPKITARMGIIDNGNGARNSITDPRNGYDGWIGIELRGNSTQYLFPKKPYLLETRDDAGSNLNVPLLGMPKDNDWILLAGYLDKTLLRNPLAHYLSRKTGRFSCRNVFVELVLNGKYEGVYLLMESIKPGKHRVPVAEMDSTDVAGDAVTGGYIWEVSQGSQNFGERRCFKYPKASRIRPEQIDYIRGYDDGFRQAMRLSTYADPVKGYAAWIDVDSFIDEILVQEACKNSDAYGWSSFFFKDRLGKLNAGPVWDFDQALSNSTFSEGDITSEWQIEKGYWEVPFFWQKLFHEPNFKRRLSNRWFSLRRGPFGTDSLMAVIDGWTVRLDEARKRNFDRWPILGKEMWRSLPGWEERDTYEAELEYMKRYLREHLDWMDSELLKTSGLAPSQNRFAEAVPEMRISPNPFRSGTTIRFSGKPRGPAEFVVYNLLGQRVARMTMDSDATGAGTVQWDGRDERGSAVAGGVYLIQWIANGKKTAATRIFKF